MLIRLLAYNKQNGVGYFKDENKLTLSTISFPYTSSFIRSVSTEEMEFAIDYYGFHVCNKDFKSLLELVDFLKGEQVDSIKENKKLSATLSEIDPTEILSFANEKMLMMLCDKIENSLLTTNVEEGIRQLKLIDATARVKKCDVVISRIDFLISINMPHQSNAQFSTLNLIQGKLSTDVNMYSRKVAEFNVLKKRLAALWHGKEKPGEFEHLINTQEWQIVLGLLSIQIPIHKSVELPQWVFKLMNHYENKYRMEFYASCQELNIRPDLGNAMIIIDNITFLIKLNDTAFIKEYYEPFWVK